MRINQKDINDKDIKLYGGVGIRDDDSGDESPDQDDPENWVPTGWD